MKLSKVFLSICIVLGIAGWTSIGGDIAFGVLRPLSAVFFILFFASSVLEAAALDHEQQTQPASRPVEAAKPEAVPHAQPAAAH